MPNNIPNNRPNNIQGHPSGSPSGSDPDDAAPAPARPTAGAASAAGAGDAGERLPAAPPARNTAMQASLISALADRQGRGEAAASAGDAACRAAASQHSVQRREELQLAPLSREALMASWDRWAREGAPSEGRGEAVRRMSAWLEGGRRGEQLELGMLQLRSLPPHLPPGLRRLDISYNEFPHFPGDLPETLEALECCGNDPPLEHFPVRLPSGLREIALAENNLRRLPDNLPAGLRQLSAQGNHLTSVPETLPEALQTLEASENRITRLPTRLPASLALLDLQSNSLTTLPDTIFQLSPDCEVHISNNPLSDAECAQLSQRVTRDDYFGPTIFFSMANDVQPASGNNLHDAVATWLQSPGADEAEARRPWQAFASEPGAAAFARFLDRLADTINACDPTFQRSIGEWLTQLETRDALRRQTFLLSEGATASCEDRVSLTLNAMRQLRLAFDVEQGDYDQHLPELLTLGRGMFRLDKLEGIAREKAASLRGVDEIEVYLAYQVKLRERLALPLDVSEMRYFDVSYVTQDDLDLAQARVMAAEKRGFADYLATGWQPWQSVLKRLEPQAYAAANEALIEAMDEPFADRLRARLRETGLENDADAERIVGAQVRAEIEREIKGQLTQDFLARHGLEDHL